MQSAAYMAGVLDTLVKAGAVSQGYADGLVDGLSKQADWAPWADSAQQNYWEEVNAYAKAHPERVQGGSFQISPDEAAKLIDNSRHWWTGAGQRSATYLSYLLRKWTRWLPGNNMTGAMYDRELEDSRNKFRRDYMRDQLMQNGMAINPQVAAAVQDKHYRDAQMRVQDARRTMGDAGARAKGYDDRYAQSFRTEQGNAAVASGQYRPVYDTKNTGMSNDSTSRYKWDPEKVQEAQRMYGANWKMVGPGRRRFY